jgi:ATP-dependent Clp protease, protease subunit
MKPSTRHALIGLALITSLPAREAPAEPAQEVAAPAAPAAPADPAAEAARKEQESLAATNKLEAERLQAATNELRSQISKLKLERELIGETMALEAAKRQVELKSQLEELEAEKETLAREGEVAKIRAEKLTNDLKIVQSEAAIEITRLQNDIARIETAEKRAQYADSEPVYLENPLKEDGTLVISDRRIPLNGPISSVTADFVTSRIDYWNNKDRKLPIFIVIDDCPGGSVMAGYRILKAMEASDAPVHVVVKSFAASMAACITTLAEESYAYPNAVILHHQISSQLAFARLNLTQQREFFEESTRWWDRLATPVAEKMGITTEELIKRMYDRSTSGDWSEFGDTARDLKWVNHIVSGIEESSVVKDPDARRAPAAVPTTALTEEIDDEGKPFAWLPRLNPKDVYFLYNPDSYYRMR